MATPKKRGFRSWVLNRIETQKKLTIAAAASMAAVGLVLFIIEAGLLYLILATAWGSFGGFLFVVLLFAGMGWVSRQQAEKGLADATYRVVRDGKKQRIRAVPATSHVWTWAFGSMESDQSVLSKVVGLAMLVPRLFLAAWHTYHRIDDVRNIDADTTVEVLKILFRRSECVPVSEIALDLGEVDLQQAIRDVSLLDGIVFLTPDNVGISLAPRLHEDYEAWRSQDLPEKDNDSLFG